MYRPTFAVDSIGEESPKAVELALRNMGHLLNALVEIDREYMRAFPEKFPPLFKSGVRYDRMEPPPGSACGDDDWQDVVVTYDKGMGDCEDLACIRVAELRERWGVAAAAPMVTLRRDGDGVNAPRHLYHVMVRWPDALPHGMRYPSTVRRENGMLIECPSRVLGMK